VNVGLASIGEILRNNDNDLTVLCDKVVEKLVNYMKANQGGVFIIKKEPGGEEYLELMASRAYERKKYLDKRIEIGHGLVGQCAIEKKRIYMTDVPDGYINITSGLGLANPKSLLIVPLKTNEEMIGVVEMASFEDFDDTDIEFLEKVGESIAATIISAQTNQTTKELLEESQEKEEIMKAQEEEMRQNMEEMQATQEDAQRKEEELARVLKEFRQNVVERDINEIEIATHNALENAKKEVNFLDEVPPIAGIFRALENNGYDSLDDSSLEVWISRLTTILQKLIENKGIYSYVHVSDIEGNLLLEVIDNGDGTSISKTEGVNISGIPIFENTKTSSKDAVYVAKPVVSKNGKLLFPMGIPLHVEGVCKGVMQLASYGDRIIQAIKNKENNENAYCLLNVDGESLYKGEREGFTPTQLDRSICINEDKDYCLTVKHYSTL
ncbi:MAG: GAF domain-containing protein, partial [Bacteroidota bacterium]